MAIVAKNADFEFWNDQSSPPMSRRELRARKLREKKKIQDAEEEEEERAYREKYQAWYEAQRVMDWAQQQAQARV